MEDDQLNINFNDNAKMILEKRYLSKDQEGNVIETPEERFWNICLYVASAEIQGPCSNIDNGVQEWESFQKMYDSIKDENHRMFCKDDTCKYHRSIEMFAFHAERFYYELIIPKKFFPNSPTIANAGKKGITGGLQACVVISPQDTLESIYQTVKEWALTEKFGAGVGGYFGDIRPKGTHISTTHGSALGPIAIMEILSKSSEKITQGSFREGAHMAVLPITHPDILEFIHCKDNCKLPTDVLSNFNISVSVTDKFMNAVRKDEHWTLQHKNTEENINIKAKLLWSEICKSAWATGDPGIIFIDRIRENTPNPHLGPIQATNPCGEEPLENYGSCNLGSINLSKFTKDRGSSSVDFSDVNWEALESTVSLATMFLDNVITVNSFPTDVPQLRNMNLLTRRIGLGVMGWHDMLVKLDIPYESTEATDLATRLSLFITEHAWKTSENLAITKGAFPEFNSSRLKMSGAKRNSSVTTIAPTGTISILAGCSSGIEPYYSLVTQVQVLWKEGAPQETILQIPEPLQEKITQLGLSINFKDYNLTSYGELLDEDIRTLITDNKGLFKTAHSISAYWHVKHQAAWQSCITNGVSKTINLPHDVTTEAISQVYWQAWEEKCKATSIYRDGSKSVQILDNSNTTDEIEQLESSKKPTKRPRSVKGETIGINTGHGKIYITVNSMSNKPFEVFSTVGKAGGCDAAHMEAIARLISMCLRSNIDIDEIIDQLRNITCCPIWDDGFQITSVPDAISKVLYDVTYPDAAQPIATQDNVLYTKESKQLTLGACIQCSGQTIYEEGCLKCTSCGWNKCG